MSIRVNLIDEIVLIIATLNAEIQSQAGLGKFDLAHDAEDIYRGILNIVLGCNLQNVDTIEEPHPGVDLADLDRRLAIQVTTAALPAKFWFTIEKFMSSNQNLYFDRLIFLITGPKTMRHVNMPIPEGFSFDPAEDIWNEAKLFMEIERLEVTGLKQLRDYLYSQVSTPILPKAENPRQEPVHQFDQILFRNTPPGAMIDGQLLQMLTIRYDYDSLVDLFNLDSVQSLYVIAAPELGNWTIPLSMYNSCHISHDNTWLLLYMIPADKAETVIARCKNARSIVISHHNLEQLTLDHCHNLKNLEIIANAAPVHFSGLGFLSGLERLDINGTELADPLDLYTAASR